MAGILLSMGNNTEKTFHEIRKNYEDVKKLKSEFEYFANDCQLSKYERRCKIDEKSYYESNTSVVCVVGTILYKDYSLESSLFEIGESIDSGALIDKIINEIDGHFILVIIKKIENRLYLITDHAGVINTYFIKRGKQVFISTSMLSLAATFKVKLDLSSTVGFIRSGIFFDETTYFNEIKVLKPASIYIYDFKSEELSRSEYWHVPKNTDNSISFSDGALRISNALKKIISKIPVMDSIYDFTGGFDSRLVLCIAHNLSSQDQTISGFYFGPHNSREAKIVEENCKNLEIDYINFPLNSNWPQKYFDYCIEAFNLCDGLENICSYAPILWTKEQKVKRFKYSVHGLFGELYRPKLWELELGVRGKRRPANLRRTINYKNLADNFDRSIFTGESHKLINTTSKLILKIYQKTNKRLDKDSPNSLQLDNVYFSQKARRWGGRNITTTNQLIKPICPLWFKRPLEISMALRPQYKKACRLTRYIAENESKDFANEKMNDNSPFLVINHRNLYRFLPAGLFYLRRAIRKLIQILFNRTIWTNLTMPDYNTDEWFREALKDPRCEDLLNYDKMVSKQFYDKDRFKEFIKKAKKEGFHFYGQLGNIITVEMVLRKVYKNRTL